ncbi:hypothetical protein niasHT_001102 [Heterodera trifolii]|uniref:Sulfatase N-terminal domain-containing protein n=1 Tax=Heterodera trifolii TaxID=157864 RepID=A0ABD2LVS2_9BILA
MIRPNIVLLITDDQDIELGSMAFMPKTLRLLQQRGTEFRNAFVSTPICCPSRSTILTGLYAHNHKVMTNNGNCAGEEWRSDFEKDTFAVYLERTGFLTGFFGKYLNNYDGSWVPPGWTKWAALVRNSRYYNYSLNKNGRNEWHGNRYENDYLTNLVANLSLQFIDQSVLLNPHGQPFLVVLSFPAPHGPEDPAPQFADLFEGVETHRTDSWNYAPNPDKQWLLKRTGKMEPIHVAFTDQKHRRRLQTLQSVDDAVNRLVQHLRFLNRLHNTFILYTSDHGYHLGQFGLVKGKSMPYEFDIRVPLLMRGPGIPRGKIIRSVVSNIDIAPTILDIAGLNNAKLDGRSMLELDEINGINTRKKMAWRETVLIERGKMPKLKRIGERLKQQKEGLSRKKLIQRECDKSKRGSSRSSGKSCGKSKRDRKRSRWQCAKDAHGKWHIIRCPLSEEEDKLCEYEEERKRGKREKEARDEGEKGEEREWEEEREERGEKERKRGKREKEARDEEEKKEEREWEEEREERGEEERKRGKREKEARDEEEKKEEREWEEEREERGEEERKRGKREKDARDEKEKDQSEGGNEAEDEEEHFWMEMNKKEVLESEQWHQGIFDEEEKRRRNKGREERRGKTLARRELKRHRLLNKSSECKCQKREREWTQRTQTEKKSSSELGACRFPQQMNCFVHSADHWHTPPFWPEEFGRFCFCQNANNNSFWCLRTVNASHNFLYCEFVTEEIAFYDLEKDPYQLENAISEQTDNVIEQLSAQLQLLKSCENKAQLSPSFCSADCPLVLQMRSFPLALLSLLFLVLPNAFDAFLFGGGGGGCCCCCPPPICCCAPPPPPPPPPCCCFGCGGCCGGYGKRRKRLALARLQRADKLEE